MTTDSSFKIGVYEQVAERMNEARIVHCAAHGIDYRIHHYGRDVDVMIRHQDKLQVRRIIKEVFENNGIQFKINKFTWADWIIGYKVVGEQISFIEIDLFYHIYYRLIELTDPQQLGISEDPRKFFIADWNTYAKVVLTKFFGLDFKKLKTKKWLEVKRVTALLDERKICKYEDLCLKLNAAIGKDDFEAMKLLKKKYTLNHFAIQHPLTSFSIFLDCIAATLDRRLHAFYIIPVILLPISTKKVVNDVKALIEGESFISSVNEVTLCKFGILDLLKKYFGYRHRSEPLSLNILYVKDDDFALYANNSFVNHFCLPMKTISLSSIFQQIC